MARRYIFVCDGCDTQIEKSEPSEPNGWSEVRIALEDFTNWYSGGGKSRVFRPLLCPSCQLTAAEGANPKNWPRPEKERSEP